MTVRRRVWTEVSVARAGTGFDVRLDGRPIRTPQKAAMILPTRALADGVAAEWSAQGAEIEPETMPLTRAANSALDRVSPNMAAVAEMLAAYADTDLLCYRATAPAPLVERQTVAWDPWLDWARATFGIELTPISGVLYSSQPAPSVARLGAEVATFDAFELTALHDLVTLSGSLILALAVARGALTADAAWPLSRVDEIWQESQWGQDAEATEAAANRARGFANAARLLDLVRTRP